MTVSNVAQLLHILPKAVPLLVAVCCMGAIMKDKILQISFPEKRRATLRPAQMLTDGSTRMTLKPVQSGWPA